jgi:hypothetical protein
MLRIQSTGWRSKTTSYTCILQAAYPELQDEQEEDEYEHDGEEHHTLRKARATGYAVPILRNSLRSIRT